MEIITFVEWLCFAISSLFCVISIMVEIRARCAAQRIQVTSRRMTGGSLLVSVLVPAYNEERVIGCTIRAILSSNWRRLEIVVVDDGSSDRTAQTVSELSDQDDRVRLIRLPRNTGKASALNVALAAASAEYVVTIDGDTIPDAEFVERMLQPMLEGRADAVAGHVKTASRFKLAGALQTIEYIFVCHTTRLWQDLTNSVTTIAGAAGAMKRSAVVSVGGYSSETMAEDADLTLRLRQRGFRVVYLPDAIVHTEIPISWGALFHQRVRWFYGNMQCIGRQLRSLDGGAGLCLSGLPTFAYGNLVMPLVEFGRACIPIIVALGWAPLALLYAYLAFLLVVCGSVVLTFRLEGERAPSIQAIVVQYSVWPFFLLCPNVVAMWNLLTHRSIGWGKAVRGEVHHPSSPHSTANSLVNHCVRYGPMFDLTGRPAARKHD